MSSSAWSAALTFPPRACLGQRKSYALTIRHESVGFLDRLTVARGPVLALMPHGAVDTLEVHDALHDFGVPRCGLSWVLMQKLPALGCLVLVERAAEAKVPDLSLSRRRPPWDLSWCC